MSRIELIGESEGSFLFAYKDSEGTPERCRGKQNHRLAFIYSKDSGVEKKIGCQLLGSIIAHNPYWEKPSTKFSNEELEHIALLLTEQTKLPVCYRKEIAGITLVKERKCKGLHDYVFAFIGKDNTLFDWGFMYSASESEKTKYGTCLLDALYEHESGWETPETKFTEAEEKDIMNLEVTGTYAERSS